MANLRDIRTRISSIKNTQQITKAMKMVAAAKLRKAQQKMQQTRPYAKKMGSVVTRLVGNSDVSNDLLRQPEEINRVCIIVVGSDRGLCGGFNNNLFRKIEDTIHSDYQSYHESGMLDIIAIGRKANAYFPKRKYNVVSGFSGFFDNLNYEDTSDIMQDVTEQFVSGYYDKVVIAFNEFKTVISQNRLLETVLPISVSELGEENDGQTGEITDYIYEPDVTTILDKILPVHVNMQLWRAVLDSNASEQGARMAAMDNATENAKELEEELQLKYNQARQSAITTEISEIVSGAAALEDN
jgi:F-type H+-transporting ATPase subunit gamma